PVRRHRPHADTCPGPPRRPARPPSSSAGPPCGRGPRAPPRTFRLVGSPQITPLRRGEGSIADFGRKRILLTTRGPPPTLANLVKTFSQAAIEGGRGDGRKGRRGIS